MHKYFSVATEYISQHQPKQVKRFVQLVNNNKKASIRVAGLAVIVLFIGALFVYDRTPHYTYQPAKACDLLTPSMAMDILGDKVINHEANKPVVSGNTAVSKCSYSDQNAEQSQMKVVAIAVRSAVEDEGMIENKRDFEGVKKVDETQSVSGLGSAAFYDTTRGQLNVIDGRNWLIINISAGGEEIKAAPMEEAVSLARKVIGQDAEDSQAIRF